MPEVETLTLMNDSTHPFAEVCVTDPPLTLRILVHNQLLQVLEVKGLLPSLIAKVAENVFNGYISVVVCV